MTRRAVIIGPFGALGAALGASPEAQGAVKGDFYADHTAFARAWNRWILKLKHLSPASPDFEDQVRREASAVGLKGCWELLTKHL